MSITVGIDMGSTTVKFVILNEHNEILYKSYDRHKSKAKEMVYDKFNSLKELLQGEKISLAITGSAGLGFAHLGNLPFVQEVFACGEAVKKYEPQCDVVIELGGEDAKILFLKGAIEERMNSTCAGGTGAFIDQMAALLNLELEEFDKLSLNHTMIYPIASRCGVFAKTDLQPLINQGADKGNLAASIFQSVVDQTITGLAQGRKIEGNVLFLGGPLSFLKGLQKRFVETLNLRREQAVFPEIGPYFVALGAATYAKAETESYTYDELLALFEKIKDTVSTHQGCEPLFKDEEDYQQFVTRHNQKAVAKADLSTYKGNAYLGIDAGSTTTKLVLIDDQNRILYSHYTSNLGNPVDVVLAQLKEIYAQADKDMKIHSGCVTGYGEDLIKSAFHVDHGIVETIAHFNAARYFNPNVDFILDIGGQDMKCFRIKDNSIDDILLNEACSSGCGSFLESFASSLGYKIDEFSKLGLKAKNPVNLGTRCTVFMNSSVKQAQKNGATIEDISAGLAISVVKNALYKVIRARSSDDLGQNIVVQGGTFANDAVLAAFEKECGHHVIRPTIAGLMGAYGAALYAKVHAINKVSSIYTKEQLDTFTHITKAEHCRFCANHCNLTINTFNDGSQQIAGNKCERPLNQGKIAKKPLPDLYTYKFNKLLTYQNTDGTKGTIGIPMVLNMYENIPFWQPFFKHLGYSVVLSGRSSRALYIRGQNTIPSDTICYPAKLVHGHIQTIINHKVDKIFYPCMSYNFDENISDNNYNCPVVAYYPEVIQNNMELANIPLISFFIGMQDPKVFEKKIYKYLKEAGFDCTKKEIKQASAAAYEAYHQYKEDIYQQGEKALAYAKENNLKTVILCGRPYHVDPEINHGIPQLLTGLDLVVVSEDSLRPQEKMDVNVLNQWTYHARMYNAAAIAGELEDTECIQLISFGCGIDAITGDELRDQLRNRNKLYTGIKIDEIDNLGAVRIRIRSLLAAMEERKKYHE